MVQNFPVAELELLSLAFPPDLAGVFLPVFIALTLHYRQALASIFSVGEQGLLSTYYNRLRGYLRGIAPISYGDNPVTFRNV